MKHYLFILILFLSFSTQSKAQRIAPFVQFGQAVGGQATSTRLYIKNSLFAHTGVQRFVGSGRFSWGVFSGIERFEEETLMPIGAQIVVMLKPAVSGAMLLVNAGHAFAFEQDGEALQGFELYGGPFMSVGYGYRWMVSENGAIACGLQYRQQYFSSELKVPFESTQRTSFAYHLVQFQVGYHF